MRKIDITPHKSLMEKIGNVGFTPEEAIAEFIDNSLDAKYDPRTRDEIIQGSILVTIKLDDERITIADNSAGILDFDNCMRLAFSEKESDISLGQFGLGLKTASMSLGRRVTIKSTRIGEGYSHKTTLDIDAWYENNEWVIEVEDSPVSIEEHWTEIVIEKLYVNPSLYLDSLRRELADRFGEFIRNKELNIKINDLDVVVVSPEFLDPKKDVQFQKVIEDLKILFFKPRKEFSFEIEGMVIRGWVNLLKERSLTGRFGFNIYRGRRLIVPFEKIGVRNHPSHANIFGHIYLPRDFPVSFTKNKIEVQRKVYTELKKRIETEISDHKRVSARMAQQKAPIVKPQTITDLNKNLQILEKIIPKSQIIKDILPIPPKEKKRALEKDADGFGQVDSERRAPKVKPTAIRPKPKNARVRNPRKKRQVKNWWYIKLPTGRIKLIHEFVDAEGNPPSMYFSEFHEDKSPPEFVVSTNTKFDAWGTTKDEAFYATGVVITALSKLIEGMATNRKASILEIYEELWRLWGKEFHSSLS